MDHLPRCCRGILSTVLAVLMLSANGHALAQRYTEIAGGAAARSAYWRIKQQVVESYERYTLGVNADELSGDVERLLFDWSNEDVAMGANAPSRDNFLAQLAMYVVALERLLPKLGYTTRVWSAGLRRYETTVLADLVAMPSTTSRVRQCLLRQDSGLSRPEVESVLRRARTELPNIEDVLAGVRPANARETDKADEEVRNCEDELSHSEGIRTSLQPLVDSLTRYRARHGNTLERISIQELGIGGSPDYELTIGWEPAVGTLRVIHTFWYHASCLNGQRFIASVACASRWKEVTGLILRGGGSYYYAATWPDGSHRCDKIDVGYTETPEVWIIRPERLASVSTTPNAGARIPRCNLPGQ